jgi:hypothetical protein
MLHSVVPTTALTLVFSFYMHMKECVQVLPIVLSHGADTVGFKSHQLCYSMGLTP